MKEDIIDAAEKRIRTSGYHGFSFREIAQDVGIKSSSVHYHFPKKSDLVVATAQRYSARFIDALGDPTDERTTKEKIDVIKEAFRRATTHDELMCLCGVLGSEIASIPADVNEPVRAFFTAMRAWLEGVLVDQEDPTASALTVIATLEGALLMARTFDDVALFDHATARLIE